MIEIRGQIARKLEFRGQLGVKLKKFADKDHFVKGGRLWDLIGQKPGVKLKNLKFNDQLGVKLHKFKTRTILKNTCKYGVPMEVSKGA